MCASANPLSTNRSRSSSGSASGEHAETRSTTTRVGGVRKKRVRGNMCAHFLYEQVRAGYPRVSPRSSTPGKQLSHGPVPTYPYLTRTVIFSIHAVKQRAGTGFRIARSEERRVGKECRLGRGRGRGKR